MHLLTALLLLAGYTVRVAASDGAGIRQLPVPASTIAAGQVIGKNDLIQRAFRTTSRSLAGIATEEREITGKETRRRLMAGRPIPLSALTRPLVVRRGSKVTVSYEEAGLSISTQLVALEDGGTGNVITARNPASGAIIRVEILSGGKLAVRDD